MKNHTGIKLIKVLLLMVTVFIVLTGCAMISNHTSTSNNQTSNSKKQIEDKQIQKFWKLVAKRTDEIYGFDANHQNTQLMNDIMNGLTAINADLTYEIGPLKKGKRDFIISANGIREIFPLVKRVVAASGKQGKLNIIAFRPRADIKEVKMGSTVLKQSQVYFYWRYEDDRRIGVDIYIKGVKAIDDELKSATFILLDSAIGEYDVETKIGGIDFKVYEHNIKGLLPFEYFRMVIDTHIPGAL